MPAPSIIRSAFALLCVCSFACSGEAMARRLSVRAAALRAPAVTMTDVEIVVDDAEAAAILQIDAGQIDIPALHVAGRLTWTCRLERSGDAARECSGPVALARAGAAAHSAQMLVRVERGRLILTIRSEGHSVVVTLPTAGEAPTTFALRAVPVTWLAPLLDSAWSGGRVDKGIVDADADYGSDGRLGLDFNVRGGAFASDDGSVSGSDLNMQGHVDRSLVDGATSVSGRATIAAGRFALGEFATDLGGQAAVDVSFAAAGADGVWNLSDLSWRDGDVLAFTARGAFDSTALAPLRALDVHFERATFPDVSDRYGAALWARNGLAGVTAKGRIAGEVAIDGQGMQRLALTTAAFDVIDPARRMRVLGLHGGIDWARKGEQPTLALGWKTAQIAGLAIPAARARWQSLDGAMRLRDSLRLNMFGGRVTLTRTSFKPLDVRAGLRSDFAFDGIAYDAPDGAFAVSKLDARGTIALSLPGAVARAQVDAALAGGEVLIGTAYVKLPDKPVRLALDVSGSGSNWQVANLAWHDDGVVDVAAKATLALDAAKPMQALEVELREAQLRPLLDRYARSWAASKHYADLSASGSVSGSMRLDAGGLRALRVGARGAGMRDGGGRFSFDGVNGDFVWSAGEDAAPAQLSWKSIDILRLPLGAGSATLTTRNGVIGLDAPLGVDVLGGKIRLEKLRIEPRSPQGERYAASFALVGLEMAQVSAALGWPRFPGNLSGGIPEIELIGDKLALRGGLDLYVFDGHVGVSGLELQRPFGVAPTLGANVHFENLDLEQLTQAFSFGGMGGRLDGSIADLKLVDWSPVAFDAWLHTVGGGRMSYKAVADVTAIGGGGGLSTNMQTIALKLVNSFGYGKLGLRCKLADAVCAMAGIEPARAATEKSTDAGYTIVDGAGIPRISIVGHRRHVDWPTLVRRLVEATQGQARSSSSNNAGREDVMMRSSILLSAFVIASALPIACVTINVYFPEAAADKVAEQFVDKVIGDSPASSNEPAATPAPAPSSKEPPPAHQPPAATLLDLLIPSAYAQDANLNVQSPKLSELQSRMRARFGRSLAKYFAAGALGFANDGTIALRDVASVPLPERAELNAAVSDENLDRKAVYREIAVANGHAEWEAKIRATFAKQWIERAKPGWYYQDAAGSWIRK